jgi:hypothetical protein
MLVAALSKLGHQLDAGSCERQQHPAAVGGVLTPFDVSGPDEAVGQDAGSGKADAEKLGEPAHRGHLLISKQIDRAELPHGDVEVPPAAGRRGQQRPVDFLVGRERFID